MSVMHETYSLPDARCAGCILKIEKALSHVSGIRHVRGNATQKRIQISWEQASHSSEKIQSIIGGLGYTATPIKDAPADDDLRPLLYRLGVAAFCMMNVMALSISVWFGGIGDMGWGTTQFLHSLSAVLALPVAFYSGSVFHVPAWEAAKRRQMIMDTPISIAILVTYLASLFELFRGAEHVYFDAVVGLIFFLLIGRVLEHIMHQRSGDAAANLRRFLSVDVQRVTADGTTELISADQLEPGDVICVAAGDRLSADGELMSKSAIVDESVLTGESVPKNLQKSERICAGAILISGPVFVKITKVGEATEIGQMAKMAEDVVAHKGRLQRLSDQFARGYIPLVFGGGALGFLIWYFVIGASFVQATLIAVAVLIVTCPCASGLATPAVTSRAMNLSMGQGVIIKSGRALEHLGQVDHVFIDKTGTASVVSASLDADLPTHAHRTVQKLARVSHHPFAQALVGDSKICPQDDVSEISGKGIECVDGARIGSAEFTGGDLNSDYSLWFRDQGSKAIPIKTVERPAAGFEAFLDHAQRRQMNVSLLSGDTEKSLQKFAQQVGDVEFWAHCSPMDKSKRIRGRVDQGARVMMIGDGINDCVALATADVSVSFAAASQIAQNSADVVLTNRDFSNLTKAMEMARQARALIAQNLGFAMIYNVVTIPLALVGILTPALAALLMSSSSLIVMLNALRLRMPK